MINITNAEEVIRDLLDISKTLTSVGVSYEVQKPLFDLLEDVYKKEILPNIVKHSGNS